MKPKHTLLIIVMLVCINIVAAETQIISINTSIINPEVKGTYFNTQFSPDSQATYKATIIVNQEVKSCATGPGWSCNSSLNEVTVKKDYTTDNRIYAHDNTTYTVLGVSETTAVGTIIVSYINPTFYLKVDGGSEGNAMMALPFIFRISNGKLVGISLLPIIIIIMLIFWIGGIRR